MLEATFVLLMVACLGFLLWTLFCAIDNGSKGSDGGSDTSGGFSDDSSGGDGGGDSGGN